MSRRRRPCPVCGRSTSIRHDGRVHPHQATPIRRCTGSGQTVDYWNEQTTS